MVRIGQILLLAVGCTLLSACEPLPVSVTIKARPGAEEEAVEAEDTAPAGYGTLVGTITYTGPVSDRPALVRQGDTAVQDAQVCAAVAVPDESLIVNAENKGLANAFVFLAKAPANIKPELQEVPAEPVMFDQKGCRFLPHVMAIRVGHKMLVLNDDPVAHNTHVLAVRNREFNSTVAPRDRGGVPLTYAKAENAPIEVKCDVHSWMKAYHFPVDHPYVAVTDASGKFRIEGLPAGKHTFKVWQERGGFLEQKLAVEIQPDAETTQDLSYGPDKIAARPAPAARTVDIARLQKGGVITFED